MEKAIRSLNWKYGTFISSIAALIIANSVIVMYFQDRQENDAGMINRAGRLRMLSQRATKYAALAISPGPADGLDRSRVDSVAFITRRIDRLHHELVEDCRKEEYADVALSLEALQSDIDNMKQSAGTLGTTPDATAANQVVQQLIATDEAFLLKMEGIVRRLQVYSEQKVRNLEAVQIVLSVSAIVILILEFTYFFRPTVRRISLITHKLIHVNQELATSEEELKTSLEEVTDLSKTLQISEKLYRHVLDQTTDAIYELNGNGEFIFVNQVMLRMTGYTREQLMSTPMVRLVYPDDVAAITEYYTARIPSGQDVDYQEFRLVTAEGKSVWIGQNVKVDYKEGKPTEINAVARDITAVRMFREKLTESEALYRLLSDNVTDVVILTDNERKVKFISKSCYEVLGYEVSELIGRSMISLIPSEEHDQLLKAGDELRSRATAETRIEFRLRRKDGKVITVEAHSKPLTTEKGEVMVQSSLRDISARREAERRLEESERLYKLLSQNMQDLVTLTTNDARFTFVSPSVKNMLGFEPEELLGTVYFDLVHPEDLPELKQGHDERHSTDYQNLLKPFRIRRKDGSYVWIEALAVSVRDKRGNVSLVQTTSRDITERKMFEEELIEARQKAEAAASAKSQFLSMMSHEIRTPMNAILGITNLLLDKETDAIKKEKLQLMESSGSHLLAIINDILDFSKIDAGKVHLEQVNFNLRILGADIITMMSHQAVQKGIDVRFSYDSGLPDFVFGDPVRIGQVITNLLGNAVKFTHEGHIELSLKQQQQEGDFLRVRIEVTDTGIGIPEDKSASIFESFTQAENATTRVYGGTGLGLTITQKLVKLMGGSIQVRSKVGAGSRFSVDLRLKRGEDIQQGRGTRSFDRKKLEGRIVLLVEDNSLNQLVATEYLEQWGLSVDHAMNGVEALAHMKKRLYDLVLMDLQMPGMSGYEACEQIREMDGSYFREVPIVALTASATIEVKDKVLAAGMNDYVSKPFNPADLRDVVQTHIERSRASVRERLADDFELHSHGKSGLRTKLIESAIENLVELKSALNGGLNETNSENFSRISHKVKMAVAFLRNDALSAMVDTANKACKSSDFSAVGEVFVARLRIRIDLIVSDLESLRTEQEPAQS